MYKGHGWNFFRTSMIAIVTYPSTLSNLIDFTDTWYVYTLQQASVCMFIAIGSKYISKEILRCIYMNDVMDLDNKIHHALSIGIFMHNRNSSEKSRGT